MKFSWPVVVVVVAISILRMKEAHPDEPNKAPSPGAHPMIGKEAGQIRDDNGLKMKLVWCPPGFSTMENFERVEEPAAKREDKQENDDDDVDPKDDSAPEPRFAIKFTPVKVFLTKGYWLGKYEVTQSEWIRVMKTEPWKDQKHTKEGADNPATWVSWNDATEFCRKLTEKERQAGRLSNDWEYTLPTEAQWERACRARTETKFSFGDDESKIGDHAWFWGNAQNAGELYAHPVGQKKPNPWGLCDMYGNVSEWCRDIYAKKLPGGRDPEGKADEKIKGSFRVSRGGSWGGGAAGFRLRTRDLPDHRGFGLGFRPALSGVSSRE